MLPRQPPPRGCVLKHDVKTYWNVLSRQPPPRGCVLKRVINPNIQAEDSAAASARLCVETSHTKIRSLI